MSIPTVVNKPATISVQKPEFDMTDGFLDGGKAIFCVYGAKGDGKTTTILSLPGNILAISLDRKTGRIWENMGKPDRIVVRDGLKYFRENQFDILASSAKSLKWLHAILDGVTQNGMYDGQPDLIAKYGNVQPDLILFDYVPRLNQLAEMKMRMDANITFDGGVANQNLWKRRNLMVREMHNKAAQIALKGVLYTTFIDIDREKTKTIEGQVWDSFKKPKYNDIIEEESDVVIYQYTETVKGQGQRWFIKIDSNKLVPEFMPLKSGEVIDITGRNLLDILKERGAKWG